eukprot:TRINITY_DN12839_c0_g1_i1.p1 TRINITY_DN12839_c0_g1~~TRINITY_DN12839_c0_g1_i1.p1  ORF type:complete len:130 (-),score=12.90 TRINITY_DN12839_c0_g1_i1:1-390(-)
MMLARAAGCTMASNTWPCSSQHIEPFSTLCSFIDDDDDDGGNDDGNSCVKSIRRCGKYKLISEMGDHLQQFRQIRGAAGIEYIPYFDFEWYLSMYLIFKVNLFAIITDKGRTSTNAWGLYTIGSLINHS